VGKVGEELTQPMWVSFAVHGLAAPTFWIALAGVITAWVFFLYRPTLADEAARALAPLRSVLVHKYYFDWVNEHLIVPLGRLAGMVLWKGGDQGVIDGMLVDGTAEEVGKLGSVLRLIQSGYLYSYAFWMVIGLAVLLGWFLVRF